MTNSSKKQKAPDIGFTHCQKKLKAAKLQLALLQRLMPVKQNLHLPRGAT